MELLKDLTVQNDTVWASSLKMAEYFEKEHKNVLRDIENLETSEEFNRLNFELVNYIDKKGEKRKSYNMTKNGFMMLAMGFTGKTAAMWKEKLLEAFDTLIRIVQDRDWKQARLKGKSARRLETDVIQDFIKYAVEQGSENAEKFYYPNLTLMSYRCLGFIEKHLPKDTELRDALNIVQLGYLNVTEILVAKGLKEGMEKKLPYKLCFQLAKEKVVTFANMVGTSKLGEKEEDLLLPINMGDSAQSA